jgi:hypothetical protein
MTPEQVIAWIEATRGVTLGLDAAARIAGLLRAGRASLDRLDDATLFDAEPAQFIVALHETRR